MEYLRKIRKERGISQQTIADAVNVSRVSISQYETGSREPSLDVLNKLANYFNVSVDQLIGRSEAADNSTKDSPTPPERKYKKFPVYGFIACGDPDEMTDYIVDEEYIDDSVYEGRDICLCICRGNSMAPEIADGDLVILDRNFDFINGKIYAVQVNGEMATLKKVNKNESGIDLIPLNPEYHKIHYTADQCEQLPVRILGQLFQSTKHW